MGTPLPAVFIGHGNPMNALQDNAYTRGWALIGTEVPRPNAVLSVSVQPEVAKTTRICTYDRAGMGWSEASPQPRTAREYAKELHTLLAKANERGPYVLVGHSMGGFTVIVYAHDYPAEVAGLVLVDAQDLPTSDVATPKPVRNPVGPPCHRCWRALAWCACWRIPLALSKTCRRGISKPIPLTRWPLVASKPSRTNS